MKRTWRAPIHSRPTSCCKFWMSVAISTRSARSWVSKPFSLTAPSAPTARLPASRSRITKSCARSITSSKSWSASSKRSTMTQERSTTSRGTRIRITGQTVSTSKAWTRTRTKICWTWTWIKELRKAMKTKRTRRTSSKASSKTSTMISPSVKATRTTSAWVTSRSTRPSQDRRRREAAPSQTLQQAVSNQRLPWTCSKTH